MVPVVLCEHMIRCSGTVKRLDIRLTTPVSSLFLTAHQVVTSLGTICAMKALKDIMHVALPEGKHAIAIAPNNR